jgi:hypothetical protein
MGAVQDLMAAARGYRMDPSHREILVEAINAATDDEHLALTQVAEVTGYSEPELTAILESGAGATTSFGRRPCHSQR